MKYQGKMWVHTAGEIKKHVMTVDQAFHSSVVWDEETEGNVSVLLKLFLIPTSFHLMGKR